MNYCKLYIQKYKNFYKYTLEMDLNKASKTNGYHRYLRLYVNTYRKLNDEELLMEQCSLQYNKTHILQFKIREVNETVLEYISELENLGHVEFIQM